MVGIRVHLDVHRSEDGFEPRGLAEPTQARPGSPEKVEILAARLEQGLDLYHPQDNPIPMASLDRRFRGRFDTRGSAGDLSRSEEPHVP